MNNKMLPKLISNNTELEANILQAEWYLSTRNNDYISLIKSCRWFVKYMIDDEWHFTPCRFVAYKANTIDLYHIYNETKYHIEDAKKQLMNFSSTIDNMNQVKNDFELFCQRIGINSTGLNGCFLFEKPLFLSVDEETEYQRKILITESLKGVDCDNQAKKEPIFISTNVNRVARNPRIAKTALVNASFKCEVDSSHTTFKTPAGFDYMEGHHLIPLTPDNVKHFWTDFSTNLDYVENIVCLCPTCHRHLHFGDRDERRKILAKLLEKRKEGHSLFTSITIDKLEKYYQ